MGSVEEKKPFPMTCSPTIAEPGAVFHFSCGGARFPLRVVRRITVLEARENSPEGYTQCCQQAEIQHTGERLYWYELNQDDIKAITDNIQEESNAADNLVS